MTKLAWAYTTIGLVLVSILSFTCFRRSNLERTEDLFNGALPPGSNRETIEMFLDSRQIRYFPFGTGPDPYIGLAENDRLWKRYLIATMPDNSYVPFVPDSEIRIVFYFDESWKLENFKAQSISDVP